MRELIDIVCRSGVPHLVVGGNGLSLHGVQRDTIDLDCLVVSEQREKITAFLTGHGFEETSRHGNFSRFRHRSLVFPMLDVMEVDAGTWAKMYPESRQGILFQRAVRVPSLPHYIAMKLHAIRENPERERKDAQDIIELVRANPGALSREDLEALFSRYAPPGFWDNLQSSLKS